jgi:NAD(P)-dependent dehydrogenase (short-subunit alcohol dehydrogenase family)
MADGSESMAVHPPATIQSRRVVLVTGAGSGLGQAMAERLSRGGDRVFATVRDPARAVDLQQRAHQAGLDLRFVPLELTSAASIAELVGILRAEGGLDVLIHNAGHGVYGPVEEVGTEDVVRQFAVQVFGPLELTRHLLPDLRQRHGRILWIGSLAGRLALPFQGHYSATKAAIAALSDALRIEVAPFGVTVTCVEPGDFATGFTEARVVRTRPDSPYAARAAIALRAAEGQEHGGPGPDELARVVERLTRLAQPPARRPVGRWARATCLLARWLPDVLRERLVAQNYGLTLAREP